MATDYCAIKALPVHELVPAARTATQINPANAPPMIVEEMWPTLLGVQYRGVELTPPQRIALVTNKYWGANGIDLSVSFIEPLDADLRNRILSHMNACGESGSPKRNIKFRWASGQQGDVRITRSGDGYWSYLGTDIKHISAGKPTMSLEGFTMQTPEAEYKRVVRHETLHTCGCPHEHQRRDIINLLDVAKTIAWGKQALGWDEQTVKQQILTALEERSIRATPQAQTTSLMCYQLPASITKNGQPIPGGDDLTQEDIDFLVTLYPTGAVDPPPPPPPPIEGIDVMAIMMKLFAIYQAIKAKDFALALKLFLELIGVTIAASAADHVEAEAQFQQFQAAYAAKQTESEAMFQEFQATYAKKPKKA